MTSGNKLQIYLRCFPYNEVPSGILEFKPDIYDLLQEQLPHELIILDGVYLLGIWHPGNVKECY